MTLNSFIKDEVTHEKLSQLHYLDMVISETLRMYPPFIRFGLVLTFLFVHGCIFTTDLIVSHRRITTLVIIVYRKDLILMYLCIHFIMIPLPGLNQKSSFLKGYFKRYLLFFDYNHTVE